MMPLIVMNEKRNKSWYITYEFLLILGNWWSRSGSMIFLGWLILSVVDEFSINFIRKRSEWNGGNVFLFPGDCNWFDGKRSNETSDISRPFRSIISRLNQKFSNRRSFLPCLFDYVDDCVDCAVRYPTCRFDAFTFDWLLLAVNSICLQCKQLLLLISLSLSLLLIRCRFTPS